MTVVLFGAGASYGAGHVTPRPPPLGGDLFPPLRRLFDTWRQIPQGERAIFSEDFEVGMKKIIEEYGVAVGNLMQEMAIFFSCFGISNPSENRYYRLVNAVNDPTEILWSTINYECLAEIALTQADRSFHYFPGSDLEPDDVRLFKLHGSCNFKVTNLKATRGVHYNPSAVKFSGGIQPIDTKMVPKHYRGNTALYPAMALYAQGKPISMSPGPIEQIQEVWATKVLDAARVAVVGVRPNPDDEHLWEPLAQTDACIGYIGKKGEFADWERKHRGDADSVILGETWEDAEEQLIDFINRS